MPKTKNIASMMENLLKNYNNKFAGKENLVLQLCQEKVVIDNVNILSYGCPVGVPQLNTKENFDKMTKELVDVNYKFHLASVKFQESLPDIPEERKIKLIPYDEFKEQFYRDNDSLFEYDSKAAYIYVTDGYCINTFEDVNDLFSYYICPFYPLERMIDPNDQEHYDGFEEDVCNLLLQLPKYKELWS